MTEAELRNAVAQALKKPVAELGKADLENLESRRVQLKREIHALGERQANWSEEDRSGWTTANAEFDTIVAKQNATEEFRQKLYGGVGRHDVGPPNHGAAGEGRGMRFRDLGTGQELRALLPDQPLTACFPGVEPMSIGRCLHAILTNRTAELSDAERRSMLGASDTGGGYLLAPQLASQVLDLARAASVSVKAGAQTVPMTGSEMHLARIGGDATGHWRPETVAVTASDVTFDRLTLKPKTLSAIVPASIELLEDAPNGASVIEGALQAALGLAVDQAILTGTGAASEPLGIRNHTGVNAITAVGTPADYSKITAAIGDVLGANFPGDVSELAWILHPRDGQTFDGLQDTTDQPLRPTPWVEKLRRLYTTSLPTTEGVGTNESVSILGDFRQVLIAARTRGLVVRVLDAGQVTHSDGGTINAASQLMRLIVAYLRVDVAVLRPTWFTLLTGITTA